MFLGQFFVITPKNDPRTLLNGPNRTNYENRKNAGIAGNGVKKDPFGPSKSQNSGIFQDIYFKFCIRIHLTGYFHIYTVFFENSFFFLF